MHRNFGSLIFSKYCLENIYSSPVRNDNKFSSDGRAVKGINCMKFSQLNARVRKKRKGKQILRVLPALLFSLPRYITFEIPVRRAESTKRGGSRLVSYEYNAPFSVSPPLPSFIPFSHCLHVCTCVHRAFPRDRPRDLSIFSKPGSLSPVSSVHGKLKRIPFFLFLFLSLILGKKGSSFFLLFIPSFLPFFFFKI